MSNNNDKKILNVPALRFPEFSGEWETHSLGEIGETIIGLTYKPSDVVENKGTIGDKDIALPFNGADQDIGFQTVDDLHDGLPAEPDRRLQPKPQQLDPALGKGVDLNGGGEF